MKKNTSDTDRILRLIIGAILAMFNLTGIARLPESILVWVVVVILGLTSLIGHCPMYTLFGINTKDKRKYEDRQ